MYIHGRMDPARSDFDYAFSCLYDAWTDCVFWNTADVAFPQDDNELTLLRESLDRHVVGRRRRDVLLNGAALRHLGRYIRDDWNEFVTLKNTTLDIEQIWKPFNHMNHGYPQLFYSCGFGDSVLHNWDGVYWEIFTLNEIYLKTLIDFHKSDKGLDIRKVTYGLDYPNPREAELPPAIP